MNVKRFKRQFALLAVILTATAFFLAPLHVHQDGGSHTDCALCRLVQALSLLVFFSVVMLLGISRQIVAPVTSQISLPPSLCLASPLGLRAPPAGF